MEGWIVWGESHDFPMAPIITIDWRGQEGEEKDRIQINCPLIWVPQPLYGGVLFCRQLLTVRRSFPWHGPEFTIRRLLSAVLCGLSR
jgi:hypothetical protein